METFRQAWQKRKVADSVRICDFLWYHQESNRGHKDFQSFALPTELWHQRFAFALQRYDFIPNLPNYFLSFLLKRPICLNYQSIMLIFGFQLCLLCGVACEGFYLLFDVRSGFYRAGCGEVFQCLGAVACGSIVVGKRYKCFEIVGIEVDDLLPRLRGLVQAIVAHVSAGEQRQVFARLGQALQHYPGVFHHVVAVVAERVVAQQFVVERASHPRHLRAQAVEQGAVAVALTD